MFDVACTGATLPDKGTCANTVLWHLFAQWAHNRYVLAFFYFVLMVNIFIAIALVADIFVNSIQTITSQTRRVKSNSQVIRTKIWNQTVANFSLMAFGSSTPEILLATIEIIGNKFKPDKLGPGTIVGASMFNTFVITGFCVIAVQGQSKSIKNVQVFWLSTFFSLMAYVWLYLIIQVITPNQVTIAEAAITVLMFPLMILSGYVVDKYFASPLSDQKQENKSIFPSNNGNINNSVLTIITNFAPSTTDHLNVSTRSLVELPVKSVTCLRNVSQVVIPVIRRGLSRPVLCQIATVNQSAQENVDFVPINETVTLQKTQMSTVVPIEILPNDSRHDASFLVYLTTKHNHRETVVLGNDCVRIDLVNAVNRKQAQFVEKLVQCKHFLLSVSICRESYQETPSTYRWLIVDNRMTSQHEYNPIEGEIIFINQEKIKHVDIAVLNNTHNRSEYFYIILIDPQSDTQVDYCKVIWDQPDTDRRAITLSERFMQAVELERNSGVTGYVLHVFSLFWKILFVLIPSTRTGGGWVTFACSILLIALLTAIMGDLAQLFGCSLAISTHLTGLTLVAVGTSLPDLFTSRIAAQREMYADDAIGNINGSNAFNVFLGLGFPWLCATVYHHWKGTVFTVSGLNDLTFSVILFATFSVIQLSILMLRRRCKRFGNGELGGPRRYALATCFLLVALWLLYITLALIR